MRQFLAYVFGPIPLVSWFLATFATAYVGPFGTYNVMAWQGRAIYWAGIIGLSVVMSLTILFVVSRMMPERSFWLRAAITALSFSALYSAAVHAINRITFAGQESALPTLPELFVVVLAISVGINFIIYLLHPEGIQTTEQHRFYKRLPPEIGTDLIRLAMQDHYIEVHTAKGRTMLLMRLSDAVEELEDVAGMQVHRSHWVALSAVSAQRSEGGRLMLEMIDGSDVPVSRSYKRAVEAATRG